MGTRRFELRPNWPDDDEEEEIHTMRKDGDLLTMEGMMQKHYSHRLARLSGAPWKPNTHHGGARISLTWRWIVKHRPQCPCAPKTKTLSDNIIKPKASPKPKVAPKWMPSRPKGGQLKGRGRGRGKG